MALLSLGLWGESLHVFVNGLGCACSACSSCGSGQACRDTTSEVITAFFVLLFLLPTANPGVGSDVIQRPAAGQGAACHSIF